MPICETIDSAMTRIEEAIETLKEYPQETWYRREKLQPLGLELMQLGTTLNSKGCPGNECCKEDWED